MPDCPVTAEKGGDCGLHHFARSYTKPMELSKEVREDITVISINGDIDGATAPQLQNFVVAEIQPNCRIFLDTSKVEYMSSAGLRVLLVLYRKINESHGAIVLLGVSTDIYDAMSATGFLRHFILVNTFEEGVKALKHDLTD